MHRSKRYDEAERHYRAAIDIFPTYYLALFNLATLLHTTGASIKQPPSDNTSEKDGVGSEASARASKSTRATSWASQEDALSLYRASIETMPRMPEVSALYELFLFFLKNKASMLESCTLSLCHSGPHLVVVFRGASHASSFATCHSTFLHCFFSFIQTQS